MSLSRKAAKAQDHKIREQLKRMDNIAVAHFLLFRCVWPLLAGVSWRYGHYLGGISIALDTSLVSGLLAKNSPPKRGRKLPDSPERILSTQSVGLFLLALAYFL